MIAWASWWINSVPCQLLISTRRLIYTQYSSSMLIKRVRGHRGLGKTEGMLSIQPNARVGHSSSEYMDWPLVMSSPKTQRYMLPHLLFWSASQILRLEMKTTQMRMANCPMVSKQILTCSLCLYLYLYMSDATYILDKSFTPSNYAFSHGVAWNSSSKPKLMVQYL